jgi:hypothetical protein
MKRAEHFVIALLAAALAALSYLHFRPHGAESARVPDSPAPPPGVAPEVRSEEDALPMRPGAASPLEDSAAPRDAEARAKAYQEKRAREAREREQGELDRLLEFARRLLAEGGVEALLWAEALDQNGEGNDEDLRRLIAQFAKETDPAALWALAQRIRFHLTDPRGRLWTVDQEAYREFETWAREEPDAFKRGFALGSAGSTGWGKEGAWLRDRMLNDPDARLRGRAAGLLPPAKNLPESEARPVADRYRELLDDRDERVRESAARGYGGWAYRESDAERLIEAARRDSSEGVRAAAAAALGSCVFDTARKALAEIAADPAQPAGVRAAAEMALAGGVVPGK